MYEQEAEWIIKDSEKVNSGFLQEASEMTDLAPLVLRLLTQRGISDTDQMARFLQPKLRDLSDPFLLPEMDLAVDRILKAIDAKESVVLYGDYDADGVTSIAVLKHVLCAYGLDPKVFLPSRLEEGYGMSKEGLEKGLEANPTLVIAVDCGTASLEEIAWLKEREIETIVLDHHEPSPHGRPDCVALVNPKTCSDCGFEYFCSAGIVFKLGHALLKTRPLEDFDLREYMDIVAVGTVADIVPLVDENRLIVRRGLRQLERTIHQGLAALKKIAGVRGHVNSMDVGYRIGPRLNAAGRLDTAKAALDLLLTQDSEEAEKIAYELDEQNRARQTLEQKIFAEAQEQLEDTFDPETDPAIVLGSSSWHPGVVGIVASRIARNNHRPAIVVAFDENGVGKGSGRSVRGVSLVKAIHECSDVLEAGGGHEMAAGITVVKKNFEEFRKRFSESVRQQATPDLLRPKVLVDAETNFADLTLELLDSYELLQPFGNENPQPLLMARNVQLVGAPRTVGTHHLRLLLQQGRERRSAMYFDGAPVYLPRTPWDVAFTIERNIHRNMMSLQLIITAIRRHEPKG